MEETYLTYSQMKLITKAMASQPSLMLTVGTTLKLKVKEKLSMALIHAVLLPMQMNYGIM